MWSIDAFYKGTSLKHNNELWFIIVFNENNTLANAQSVAKVLDFKSSEVNL